MTRRAKAKHRLAQALRIRWLMWIVKDGDGSQKKTDMDLPINPENLLNVLGILTLGLTSIKTPFAV